MASFKEIFQLEKASSSLAHNNIFPLRFPKYIRKIDSGKQATIGNYAGKCALFLFYLIGFRFNYCITFYYPHRCLGNGHKRDVGNYNIGNYLHLKFEKPFS